jgi:hypothetical protein
MNLIYIDNSNGDDMTIGNISESLGIRFAIKDISKITSGSSYGKRYIDISKDLPSITSNYNSDVKKVMTKLTNSICNNCTYIVTKTEDGHLSIAEKSSMI